MPRSTKANSKARTKNGKSNAGRPSKYKPEYCDDLITFFGGEAAKKYDPPYADKPLFIPKKPPLFVRFAQHIGVHMDTLTEWRKRHPEFSSAYKMAKALQRAIMIEGALLGRYHATFTIFAMKNMHGWRDKQELETSGEMKHTVEIVNYAKTKDKSSA